MKREAIALFYSAAAIAVGAVALIYLQSDPFWPSFSGAPVPALFGAMFVTFAMFVFYGYVIFYSVLVIISRRLVRFRPIIIAAPSLAYFLSVYLIRFDELSAVAVAVGILTFGGVALVQFWIFPPIPMRR